MKGMLDFLEKAGLVKRDGPTEPEPATMQDADKAATPPVGSPAPSTATLSSDTPLDAITSAYAANTVPLNLDDIYANAGIAPALYPAERLLRLVDGLSAMDEATRLMAIKAMDAADESWTIADPLADAAAKLSALAAHGDDLTRSLQQLELETQNQINSVTARQEQVVGDIRKQISELEALVSRALARAEQETAAYQANLNATREQTAKQLGEIAYISQRLQSLSKQFGASPTPSQEQ